MSSLCVVKFSLRYLGLHGVRLMRQSEASVTAPTVVANAGGLEQSHKRPAVVADAVRDYNKLEELLGGYEAEEVEAEKIEAVYRSVACLLGARKDEVAAVENATRGWDYAFYSLPLKRGDVVFTSETEYGSNVLSFRKVSKETGAKVMIVPNDRDTGSMNLRKLHECLSDVGERAKLVAVSHIPTSNAVVLDAGAIGGVCREYDVPYLLDSCQSVGQIPIDVDAIGCDVLTASARKYLRGPRGQGFMYVREGSIFSQIEPIFLDTRSAQIDLEDSNIYHVNAGAIRYENYERSFANWVGLGAAVDYALQWSIEAIEQRVISLAASLRHQLAVLPNIQVQDFGMRKSGLVTFTVTDVDAQQIVVQLRKEQIYTSVSRQKSTPFDMHSRNLASVVRASVHYYNTEDEIREFLQVLQRITHT